MYGIFSQAGDAFLRPASGAGGRGGMVYCISVQCADSCYGTAEAIHN